ISSFFPHNHELVNFLINYKLRRLPLYTQPLLREGLAIYYGGRWGKSPSALLDLAGFLYREKLVELDSLLTMKSFESNSGADISYPVAGLFAGYLMELMGHEEYLELYLALSGDAETIRAMSDTVVREKILEATGIDNWALLTSEFEAYIEKMLTERAVVLPGIIADQKEILRTDSVVITGGEEWLSFEFKVGPDTPVTGNLLFDFEERLEGVTSFLFEEQYRDQLPFDGYRYGVRFDQNEAGLYDYANNRLLAKYIWGITPSEKYYDADKNLIRIRFRKKLLAGAVPAPDDFKLLPQ
ncbi:MAG: hypothetical protein U9R56_02195, partial [candidate division Zixibacteria bacterium]|nr:hypothetical protein [candidate division Zixibacteria bacterium]